MWVSAGTKNVSKELRKITQGRVRDREVSWFSELVDKRTYVMVHVPGICCFSCTSSLIIYETREECKDSSVLVHGELW